MLYDHHLDRKRTLLSFKKFSSGTGLMIRTVIMCALKRDMACKHLPGIWPAGTHQGYGLLALTRDMGVGANKIGYCSLSLETD